MDTIQAYVYLLDIIQYIYFWLNFVNLYLQTNLVKNRGYNHIAGDCYSEL